MTIRHDQGNWIQIAPKIEKKQLFIDLEKGIETYLLKVQPGGEAPGHTHEDHEICMVLEGSLDFDDTHLTAGDFHIARKGSTHGHAYCPAGALLYMQSALAEQSVI
jgi:anti-sigma factor ChrR (cupin superfamily)